MSNFLFLKKNNEDLFKIVSEAENLFRDEYFEQSVVQIRRFAENLCKDLLTDEVTADATFDTMICKIKDNAFAKPRMKEFADDLYFLKKHGNSSAHSASAAQKEQAGKLALECLERAYEISVFYSNAKFGYDKKLDKTVFSEELLITGKVSGKKSKPILKEKYSKELEKTRAYAASKGVNKGVAQKPKIKSKSKSQNGKKQNGLPKKGKGRKRDVILPIIFALTLIVLTYFLITARGR